MQIHWSQSICGDLHKLRKYYWRLGLPEVLKRVAYCGEHFSDQLWFISIHPDCLGWLLEPGWGPYAHEFLGRFFTFRLSNPRKNGFPFSISGHSWIKIRVPLKSVAEQQRSVEMGRKEHSPLL